MLIGGDPRALDISGKSLGKSLVEKEMEMKGKVKVGIAGLGRSGWGIHAMTLDALPEKYTVVAVSDPEEKRRKEAEEKFGCSAYPEFGSLLEDPEVELLIVATPSHLHAQNAIQALEAGKKVVCEKPMATNLADADSMIEASRRTGNLLTIFQNRRFSPDFLKVKEVIQSGKLGRIVLIRICWHWFNRRWDWQTLKKFGGGELRNIASHLIDQALQLFGDVEPEVFCDLQKAVTFGDAEDHVKVLLKAPGAPTIDIEASASCAYPQDNWLVMGTQGGLSGNPRLLRWKYFNPQDLPIRQVMSGPVPGRRYLSEEIPWKEESYEIQPVSKGAGIIYYKELYKTLRQGATLPVTPESVRRVMRIIEKCYELSPV